MKTEILVCNTMKMTVEIEDNRGVNPLRGKLCVKSHCTSRSW